MKEISLPILPNCPIKKNDLSKNGKFLLKTFGEFNFIQNTMFDESLIEYNENYQNDQSYSQTFKWHMFSVYEMIKKQFPKGSTLVEVGCGKGAFLDIVNKDNYFNYKGFDSTYEGDDINIESRYLTIDDSMTADIIVLRHTLEHIKTPFNFFCISLKYFNK